MGIPCPGPTRANENCTIEKKGIDKNVQDKDVFEVLYTNAYFYTNAACLTNKLHELKILNQSLSNKLKIIAITEIKHTAKCNVLNSELQLPGYNFFVTISMEMGAGSNLCQQ